MNISKHLLVLVACFATVASAQRGGHEKSSSKELKYAALPKDFVVCSLEEKALAKANRIEDLSKQAYKKSPHQVKAKQLDKNIDPKETTTKVQKKPTREDNKKKKTNVDKLVDKIEKFSLPPVEFGGAAKKKGKSKNERKLSHGSSTREKSALLESKQRMMGPELVGSMSKTVSKSLLEPDNKPDGKEKPTAGADQERKTSVPEQQTGGDSGSSKKKVDGKDDDERDESTGGKPEDSFGNIMKGLLKSTPTGDLDIMKQIPMMGEMALKWIPVLMETTKTSANPSSRHSKQPTSTGETVEEKPVDMMSMIRNGLTSGREAIENHFNDNLGISVPTRSIENGIDSANLLDRMIRQVVDQTTRRSMEEPSTVQQKQQASNLGEKSSLPEDGKLGGMKNLLETIESLAELGMDEDIVNDGGLNNFLNELKSSIDDYKFDSNKYSNYGD